MDHHVDAVHGALEAVAVADVADQEAEPTVVLEAPPHVELLELVAAVDADRCRLVLGKDAWTKAFPKEPVAPVTSTDLPLMSGWEPRVPHHRAGDRVAEGS